MSLKGKGEPVDIAREGNRLIDSLPTRQRCAVLVQCEHIEVAVGKILCEAGEPFKYAYFPITGNISMVNALDGHQPFETESIGNEGMLGPNLILGINRAFQRGIVQTPCLALRMKAGALQEAAQRHPAFGRILKGYLYVVLVKLLQTISCSRFHDVARRLPRALLVAHDRAQTDCLPLTHLLLAETLGVQRGAVTIAAVKLQREGIIRYSRGKITILDRKGLEAKSCGCYEASIENYASFLP